MIADNLAPLGITVQIRTVDFATWLDEQNNGNFDMLMMGWLGNTTPTTSTTRSTTPTAPTTPRSSPTRASTRR